ncbi:hypothetical protein HaLaN_26534 [Haematococcus lacustris]|uniref:Uncharacterized protein n=1 Tax=Haematococcus lacustris TaxID=44745 RepID=A0A6A0A6H5_HAELA|nr:hypothetical protein HaLaN_26534 [Haematococcus lacustris]
MSEQKHLFGYNQPPCSSQHQPPSQGAAQYGLACLVEKLRLAEERRLSRSIAAAHSALATKLQELQEAYQQQVRLVHASGSGIPAAPGAARQAASIHTYGACQAGAWVPPGVSYAARQAAPTPPPPPHNCQRGCQEDAPNATPLPCHVRPRARAASFFLSFIQTQSPILTHCH